MFRQRQWVALGVLLLRVGVVVGLWRIDQKRRRAEVEPQDIHEAAAFAREAGLYLTSLRPDNVWDAGFVVAEVEIPYKEAGYFRLPPHGNRFVGVVQVVPISSNPHSQPDDDWCRWGKCFIRGDPALVKKPMLKNEGG
jgi:hypothetical protein